MSILNLAVWKYFWNLRSICLMGNLEGVLFIKSLKSFNHQRKTSKNWPKSLKSICLLQSDFTVNPVSTIFCLLVSDLDSDYDVIVSGSFDRKIRVWSFPDCDLVREIDAKHPVNCVSVYGNVAASWYKHSGLTPNRWPYDLA